VEGNYNNPKNKTWEIEEHEPFEIPTSHPSKYGKKGIREITYQLNQPSPAQERITE